MSKDNKPEPTPKERELDFRVATATVTKHAIDELLEVLNDARAYFEIYDDRSAFGSLMRFDKRAEAVKAAITFREISERRGRS